MLFILIELVNQIRNAFDCLARLAGVTQGI